MPKINREEYEVLKGLNDTWKWLVRDEKGELWAYKHKPTKENKFWREGILLGLNNGILQFIQWEDGKPYNIAELMEEYEFGRILLAMAEEKTVLEFESESEEKEVKKDKAWLKDSITREIQKLFNERNPSFFDFDNASGAIRELVDQLDEPEPKNITLQDITHRLWELPLNNRKYWLEQLNDEFQEGYIVPLGLKTTDGEEQYLTYNGSYFASRRNKFLQQTFDTLEEIPEFYRGLAEKVL